MVMAKRHYKVYADVGLTSYQLVKQLSVLDSGSGPNFVRSDVLPDGFERYLKSGPVLAVCDANRNPIRTIGRIDLVVRLGTRLVKLEFVVCQKLACPVVLGCDYMDRFVEAILPRKRLVELDDGTTVPITRRPMRRPPNSPPLPVEQEYTTSGGRTSPKVRVAKAVELQPGTQTFVEVTTERHGTMVLQPIESLFAKSSVVATNGVVQVEPNQVFRILVANFGDYPYRLSKNQIIGTLLPHPTAVIPSSVMLSDILGVTPAPPSDFETSSEVLEPVPPPPDEPPPIPGQVSDDPAELPTDDSVDNVDLSHVPDKYHERIRTLLRKFNSMWSGELGEIPVMEHRIDLVPGARPYAQHPYRAGPHARKFEEEEVDRMLRKGVIEPSQSPWASPVVLVPKKDGKLRFCVDYRKVNEVTVRDSYPLPRMDEYLDSLGEATVFTTLDANSGY